MPDSTEPTSAPDGDEDVVLIGSDEAASEIQLLGLQNSTQIDSAAPHEAIPKDRPGN